MKRPYKYLFVLICSLSVAGAYAQTSTFSNIEEVIKLALNKNPDLSIYLLQQKQATTDYKNDKNYWLPNISGTASFQNNLALSTTSLPGDIFGQAEESVDVQIGQKYNYNVGINLSKTILDREAKIKIKISEVGSKIAQAQTEIYKQTLKEQTAFYYYSALIGKHAVKINMGDLKISDSIFKITNKKFKEGIIDITIRNQAAINRNKIDQNLLSNKNIYNQSLNSLKLLLGIEHHENLNLTEKIIAENPISTAKLNLNKDKNLDLKILQEAQSVLGVKKQRASFFPTLSMNGYFGKQQLNNESGVSFKSNSWTDYSYINISASIPIFSGFSKKNKLKKVKIEKDIASQNLRIEKAKTEIKDAQLEEEYRRNLRILKHSKNSFKLTKENTDLAMKKYEEGLLSLDAYLKLYEDYLIAENNYLNTLSTAYVHYATILSRQ